MSDNNWFSHGGSLDGSPDNSNTYGSNTVDSGSSGSTFIKPVKGLNGSSSAPVRREPAPVYAQPVPVAPVPVATAMPENRCIRCGVAIPAGSTLCRNCYSAQNNAVGAGVQTQPGSGSSKIWERPRRRGPNVLISTACSMRSSRRVPLPMRITFFSVNVRG